MSLFVHYASQAVIAAIMFSVAGLLGRALWPFKRKDR